MSFDTDTCSICGKERVYGERQYGATGLIKFVCCFCKLKKSKNKGEE